MKPITADNNDGRVLLALRAGPMTPGELSERGVSASGWLIEAGFVVQSESTYRITEAGRAACPFRNPLAAPGAVQPITIKSETDMSRDNAISRQQVLAAIKDSGSTGISRKQLIERFGCAEAIIDNHIMHLNRAEPEVLYKPKPGHLVAIEFKPKADATPLAKLAAAPAVTQGTPQRASRLLVMDALSRASGPRMAATVAAEIGATVESTIEVMHGLFEDEKVDRVSGERGYQYVVRASKVAAAAVRIIPSEAEITHLVESLEPEPEPVAPPLADMIELATQEEAIEIGGIADRRGPVVLDSANETLIGIFSNGAIEITDSFNNIKLTKPVVAKLRSFLGLFAEAA